MPETTLRTVERTLIRCLVCGSSEVRTDEVLDLGWVLLAECPRCDHRWTWSGEPQTVAIRARPALCVSGEVADAA